MRRGGWFLVCAAASACGGGHVTTPAPSTTASSAPVDSFQPPTPPAVMLVGCRPTSPMPQRLFSMMGGLEGNEPGEMEGGFGYGKAEGWGTIGTGKYGTIGHGSGTGEGYGIGGGRGGMRGRMTAIPTVDLDPPKVKGGLGKAIVKRYLKRNISKLTYCYEKQLLAQPGLQGIVESELEIGADGVATSSRARGVDPEVARCVANVMAEIEFPHPKKGSTATVTAKLKAWAGDKHKKSLPAPKQDDAWIDAGEAPPPAAPEEEEAVVPPPTPTPWLPYADRVDTVGDAKTIEATIGGRIGDVSACFTGAAAPIGSMRAMLRTDGAGAIVAAQVGGLGDPTTETCVANALATSRDIGVADVACDLTRGDALPWRITRDGYDHVVEVSATELRLDGQVVTPGPDGDAGLDTRLVLVVVDASAPGAQLERALAWVGEDHRAVVAIQRDQQLVYASAIDLSPQPSYATRPGPRPSITVHGGDATACVGGTKLDDAIAAGDPAALDTLVGKIASACGECEKTIEVVLAADTRVDAALPAIAAASRAGFDAVLAEHPSDVDCQ